MDEALTLFPSLELLNVKDNKLETTESLASLGKLGDLVELRVEGNQLCSLNYRAGVMETLPKLEVLDGVSGKAIGKLLLGYSPLLAKLEVVLHDPH